VLRAHARKLAFHDGCKRVGRIPHPKATHALNVLGRYDVVMGNPGNGEGAHRAGVAIGDSRGAAERDGRKQVKDAVGLLDDDASLRYAIKAEEAQLA
jgi:hypothetical protein